MTLGLIAGLFLLTWTAGDAAGFTCDAEPALDGTPQTKEQLGKVTTTNLVRPLIPCLNTDPDDKDFILANKAWGSDTCPNAWMFTEASLKASWDYSEGGTLREKGL